MSPHRHQDPLPAGHLRTAGVRREGLPREAGRRHDHQGVLRARQPDGQVQPKKRSEAWKKNLTEGKGKGRRYWLGYGIECSISHLAPGCLEEKDE